jgi:hypothetical protein
MQLSLSKAGGHTTIEQSVTEDAKLAKFGYEQGTATPRECQRLDADVNRAQTII